MTTTNEWLTSIKVKSTFVEDPTDADIKFSAMIIVSRLKDIQKSFSKVIDDNFMDFDIILDNFASIITLIDNGDNVRDYDALGTWNSWKDAFNEYMIMLYDMADEHVTVKGQRGIDDGTYKFIWIS